MTKDIAHTHNQMSTSVRWALIGRIMAVSACSVALFSEVIDEILILSNIAVRTRDLNWA